METDLKSVEWLMDGHRPPIYMLVFLGLLGCAESSVEGAGPNAEPSGPPITAVTLYPGDAQARVPLPAVPPSFTAPVESSTSVRLSEQGALRASKVLNGLCTRESGAQYSPGFVGFWFEERPEVRNGMGTVVTEFATHAPALNADAFHQRWDQLLADWVHVDQCLFKIHSIRVQPDGSATWLRAHYTLAGQRIGGEESLTASVTAVLRGPDMEMWGIRFDGGHRARRVARAFHDVSADVGVMMFRSAHTQKMIQQQIDRGTMSTPGGLGVIDWIEDGFDDLMAWDARRSLQIFVNDGRGGFETVMDPIPREHVGLFLMYADLDGNGQPELVSSQLVGCRDGQAWFGYFERRGETFESLGPALKVPMPCAHFRRARYEHIAMDDVDGDGDLDLFFAGYSPRTSQMSTQQHNPFDSKAGLGNLLFLNDGQHRYREVGRAQKIDGRSHSYVGGFYDADRDGRRDLLVVNDFGPNQVYLNRGDGQFELTQIPGLSDNGQSMGLTVSDLNDDQVYDVYVSNMYSYAGNRIVPLVQGDVSPENHDTLMRLSRGNSLFVPTADGYQDIGPQLGVAKANWAWGHTVFDLENDGDWDVYVVNGNRTHSNARAPDY